MGRIGLPVGAVARVSRAEASAGSRHEPLGCETADWLTSRRNWSS